MPPDRQHVLVPHVYIHVLSTYGRQSNESGEANHLPQGPILFSETES